MKTRFQLFGVVFTSDIEVSFPVSLISKEYTGSFDVNISAAETPRYLDYSKFYGNAEFHENRALLNFGKRGRLLVEGGTTIKVTAGNNYPASQVLKENLPAALAILFFQRDKLLLHASCVERDGIAVAFIGDSGSGKSTLANVALEKDLKLITDDILIPEFSGDDVLVNSGPAQLRLLPSMSIDRKAFRFEKETTHSIKKLVPVPQNILSDQARLRAIVNLNWNISDSMQHDVLPLEGFEAYDRLKKNLYRPEFTTKLEMDRILFQQTAQLLGKVKVYDLYRPRCLASLSNGLDVVMNVIK